MSQNKSGLVKWSVMFSIMEKRALQQWLNNGITSKQTKQINYYISQLVRAV